VHPNVGPSELDDRDTWINDIGPAARTAVETSG
jgi:hypothetical protein